MASAAAKFAFVAACRVVARPLMLTVPKAAFQLGRGHAAARCGERKLSANADDGRAGFRLTPVQQALAAGRYSSKFGRSRIMARAKGPRMADHHIMALTPDLVARVHREVPDPGFMPGREPMDDEDYRRFTDRLLADQAPGDDLWLFAYGSLIWKPACVIDGQQKATLRGWRRSFCLRLTRFRGTPEFPGLMMALDRGGSCQGVVQRLSAASKRAGLEEVLRREISVKPPTNRPRWVTVKVNGAPLRSVAFTADRTGASYAEERSVNDTADILSRAVGHWGSGAEYLMQTVLHLEQLGIRDRYLWGLQAAVAERIRSFA